MITDAPVTLRAVSCRCYLTMWQPEFVIALSRRVALLFGYGRDRGTQASSISPLRCASAMVAARLSVSNFR